jgi:hypothetical protein
MMKPTDPTLGRAHTRLVCRRCGMSVFADTDVDHELTSISHAGATPAMERAGHTVAMDVCRHCLRDILRGWLRGGTVETCCCDAARARDALRSPEHLDAFVRASNARLDALRAADGMADGAA